MKVPATVATVSDWPRVRRKKASARSVAQVATGRAAVCRRARGAHLSGAENPWFQLWKNHEGVQRQYYRCENENGNGKEICGFRDPAIGLNHVTIPAHSHISLLNQLIERKVCEFVGYVAAPEKYPPT